MKVSFEFVILKTSFHFKPMYRARLVSRDWWQMQPGPRVDLQSYRSLDSEWLFVNICVETNKLILF
jgi:hypothetical protein